MFACCCEGNLRQLDRPEKTALLTKKSRVQKSFVELLPS
jgi:hypothetical protein